MEYSWGNGWSIRIIKKNPWLHRVRYHFDAAHASDWHHHVDGYPPQIENMDEYASSVCTKNRCKRKTRTPTSTWISRGHSPEMSRKNRCEISSWLVWASLFVPQKFFPLCWSPSLEPISTTQRPFTTQKKRCVPKPKNMWCGILIGFEQSFQNSKIKIKKRLGLSSRDRVIGLRRSAGWSPKVFAPGCRAVGHQALHHSALLQELFSDLRGAVGNPWRNSPENHRNIRLDHSDHSQGSNFYLERHQDFRKDTPKRCLYLSRVRRISFDND